MPDFIEAIPFAGKNQYFSFRLVATPRGDKYFVSTLENNDLISFEVKTDALARWHLVEPVPAWIKQMEPQLVQAIEIHLKNIG
jgi:hypothetical protein